MTMLEASPVEERLRLKLTLRGAVQGVGFRPFVYRLANELGLTGWVQNSPQGVFIEAEGSRTALEKFQARLGAEKPPQSFIQSCEAIWLDPFGYDGFLIRDSDIAGTKTALVLPDIATCPDCLREINDPADRRFRYPFTNCTHCGPRFSIIESLPYDRANTSMRRFKMCPECEAEYHDPNNRRFHAQPNACPKCGPQLELWPAAGRAALPRRLGEREDATASREGVAAATPYRQERESLPRNLAHGNDALLAAAHVIRCGQIAAVKGIGGFHLMVDARNAAAVQRLRDRKHREEKPFALLFPSLESVKQVCEVSPLEARLLCSPEAPIVLLKRVDARSHPNPFHEPRSSERQFAPSEFRAKLEPTDVGCYSSGVQCANLGLASSLPQEREDHLPLGNISKADDNSNLNRTPAAHTSCSLSPGERVRVRADVDHSSCSIAPCVAPGNPCLGVMLPSNPLHHLLMTELGFPVVATSGNLSDEPICSDEHEALQRLRGIADVFLVHNRPIVRHVDDSIVRVMAGREMVLRRARGYAPLPIPILVGDDMRSLTLRPGSQMETPHVVSYPSVLAVGAHLKNSVALAVGEQVFISQHIGDLETEPAHHAFQRVIRDFGKLYEAAPDVIVSDLHPDYLSTQFALERRAPARQVDESISNKRAEAVLGAPHVMQVQHHIAHVLSCVAENEVTLPALGVAWDGTGLGTDGTIWGGEFFLVQKQQVERIAHLRSFRLPGGDMAVKEPRRSALGLLHELAKTDDDSLVAANDLVAGQFTPEMLAALRTMLARGLNAPLTSSIGRLFDAVAALLGLRGTTRFEGQAAMELEFATEGIVSREHYLFPLMASESPLVLEWAPMVRGILADLTGGLPVGLISAKFHNTLAEWIVAVAQRVQQKRVVLSGGCFQNRVLLERTVKRLREEGFQPYWHQRVPTNDGGIALGQVVAAMREMGFVAADVSPLHSTSGECRADSRRLPHLAIKEKASCV